MDSARSGFSGEELLEAFLKLDDRTIRLQALAETLLRARLDLRCFVADVFGRTWEFRIVQGLLTLGPMNKTQLSSRLFPNLTDPHSRLSRGRVSEALSSLLEKEVINTVDTGGRGKTYDLSPVYRPALELLIIRNVTIQHNTAG